MSRAAIALPCKDRTQPEYAIQSGNQGCSSPTAAATSLRRLNSRHNAFTVEERVAQSSMGHELTAESNFG
jgi:hypothetical protein